MKRRLLPLAALLCAAVLCMTMAFAAESYTISIDVPAGTLHTGDSFTAGITLHGRAGESAPSTMQVDVIYAGCVCTDAAVTVPGALVTYAEGRLCISYLEQEAVFDENGRFLLGTITLKAGRSGIATVTASRSVGTVDGLTDVDIPAASGFSGVCSVTIYHYSSSAAEEPVGSPKTGDMGALVYCAMCAASGTGTAALWLRRRGKRG